MACAKAASSAVRRLDFAGGTASDDDSSPTWIYTLVVVVALGGGVFLVLRWRQRQAELTATSVAYTPVPTRAAAPVAPVVVPAAVRPIEAKFSDDFVARLEAGKFEALVAAYYSTTGVVAVRANGNGAGPVQIRISWKGEPRPFAGVLCVAQPTVPIEAKSLGDFTAALAKEEIRRGHIVTSGKFAQSARDFAAQNQLTLFPGETFVEKLNALPESARTEIMRSTNTAESVA